MRIRRRFWMRVTGGMKIHIIGGSGTGKSYIADKLSQKYGIPHYDLDDVFWDNTADTYGTKMPVEKRTSKLADILKKDDWVIEGVFYDWLADSFSLADRIVILQIRPLVFNARIIRRFIRRKCGLEKGKKETLRSLKDLLVWTNGYQRNNIPRILDFLAPYKDKVSIITNARDILMFGDRD